MELMAFIWPVVLLIVIFFSLKLIKKQSDLIEHYRERNRVLNEQLFEMCQKEQERLRGNRR